MASKSQKIFEKADEPTNNKNTEEYIALRNEINTRLTLKQQIADTVFDRFMVFLPILITVTTAVPNLAKRLSKGDQFIFGILPPVLLSLLAIYVFSSFLRYDENWNQVLAIAMYSIIISDRPLESPLMVWERGLFVQELKDSKFKDSTFKPDKPGRIHSLWNKEFAFCLCAVDILLEIYFKAHLITYNIVKMCSQYNWEEIFYWIIMIVNSFLIALACASLKIERRFIYFAIVFAFIVNYAPAYFREFNFTAWIYILAIAMTSAAAGYVWERSNPKHHTEKKLGLLIAWWKYAVDQGIRSNDELVQLFQKHGCGICKKCGECEEWDKKRRKCGIQELDETIICEAALSICRECNYNDDCTLAKIYASIQNDRESNSNEQ